MPTICEALKEEAKVLNAQLAFWVARRKTLSDRQQIAEADKTIDLLGQEIAGNTLESAENDCYQPPPFTIELFNHTPGGVQVSHSANTNQARAESDIAANPNNPLQIVGASKKFRDINTYDFWVAVYSSSDGGSTWTEMELPTGSWANDLVNPVIVVSDPTVTWDDKGRAYVVCSAFGRLGSEPGDKVPLGNPNTGKHGTGVGIVVWTSKDGGTSWPDSVMLASNPAVPSSDPRDNDDKMWPAFNPVTRELVIAWGFDPMIIARAKVDAPAWEIKAVVDENGRQLHGYAVSLAVLKNGALAIAWIYPGSGAVQFARSKYPVGDARWNVFEVPKVIASGFQDFEAFGENGGGFPHFPPAKFRIEAFATMATEDDVAFIAWPSKESDDSTTIRYVYSTDLGTTWQTGGTQQGQVLITSQSGKYYFQPEVAMGSSSIACAYYQFDAATGTIRVYVTAALRAGGLWQTVEVTENPWDPRIDAIAQHGVNSGGLTFIGDYMGLAAGRLEFFPLWMDTRTGVAEMYTAHVDFHKPGGIPGHPGPFFHIRGLTLPAIANIEGAQTQSST
jgi:hypothetical protein